MKTLVIDFGALAPDLWEQFQGQGAEPLDANTLMHLQRDANAITRCSIRGFISDSATHIARKRLMKLVSAVPVRTLPERSPTAPEGAPKKARNG